MRRLPAPPGREAEPAARHQLTGQAVVVQVEPSEERETAKILRNRTCSREPRGGIVRSHHGARSEPTRDTGSSREHTSQAILGQCRPSSPYSE